METSGIRSFSVGGRKSKLCSVGITSSSPESLAYLEQRVIATPTMNFGHSYYPFTGRHCCLWCHITSEHLKDTPAQRGPVLLRSDATLNADLAQFTADGSRIKRAKFFNNVIRAPLFNISVTQACYQYTNSSKHYIP